MASAKLWFAAVELDRSRIERTSEPSLVMNGALRSRFTISTDAHPFPNPIRPPGSPPPLFLGSATHASLSVPSDPSEGRYSMGANPIESMVSLRVRVKQKCSRVQRANVSILWAVCVQEGGAPKGSTADAGLCLCSERIRRSHLDDPLKRVQVKKLVLRPEKRLTGSCPQITRSSSRICKVV